MSFVPALIGAHGSDRQLDAKHAEQLAVPTSTRKLVHFQLSDWLRVFIRLDNRHRMIVSSLA